MITLYSGFCSQNSELLRAGGYKSLTDRNTMRSIYCGQLNKSHVDQEVELCGWINKRRDLGGLIFVDLRDREGLVQVVFDPEVEGLMDTANKLRQEFCVQLKGVVREIKLSSRCFCVKQLRLFGNAFFAASLISRLNAGKLNSLP